MNEQSKRSKSTFLHSSVGCFLFVFSILSAYAQSSENATLHRDVLDVYDGYFNRLTSNTHTAIKPYIDQELHLWNDSVQRFINRASEQNKTDTGAVKALQFKVQPIINFLPGYYSREDYPKLELAGGVALSVNVYNKLTVAINALAGNASYPSYVSAATTDNKIVPVHGWAYRSGLGYSHQALLGYASYSPNKIFNFQLGRGKHFFGDGYRSLFLADLANAYPYLRIATTIWKLKYVSLFAIHKDIAQPARYQNKYAAFHYLSYNITPRINIGLFESIIWQGSDTNRVRGFDVNYLNPVIFYRPVEYALGSSDNAFIGFNFKIKWCSYFQTYGQLMLDEFYLKEMLARKGWWANKQGFQLGMRFFDLFKIKQLSLRTELNYVRPYTYAHGTSKQNYGHFNRPLAHPMGANFIETVGALTYRYNNWLLDVKGILALSGADSAGYNMGQNIFKSYTSRIREYNNYTTQGIKTKLLCADVKLAYLLYKWNTELVAGATYRVQSSPVTRVQDTYIYIGIKTLLFNDYRDF